MDLTVASIDAVLWKGKATSLSLFTPSGELTILKGHMPLISVLTKGTMRIKDVDGTKKIEVTNGFLLVEPNAVTVLV